MALGRVLSSFVASAAVAGCAIVAVGMSRAQSEPSADHTRSATPTPTHTSRPVTLPEPSTAAPTSRRAAPPAASGTAPRTSHPGTTSAATRPTTTTTAPAPPPAATTARHVVAPPPVQRPAPRPTHHAAAPAPRGHRLPLGYSTGSATRVITVTASSTGRTTATLQAWTKVSGGWARYGSSVTAHIGADGMSRHASESRSATPMGSFTLTQAFGHYGDPGTSLPYLHTTPADWWISQPGRLYNTHQRCSSHCAFTRGDPNEHLYYETPYYNYAVVIDYNTRNAPGGVHQGRGSAFFLHVTDGAPTAGCVAIPQSRLVPIMRWLTPSAHPRILIGTT